MNPLNLITLQEAQQHLGEEDERLKAEIDLKRKMACAIVLDYLEVYDPATLEADEDEDIEEITQERHVVPSSPGPYEITVTESPWVSNVRVQYFIGGGELEEVEQSPVVSEYFVQDGVYTFHEDDADREMMITYEINSALDDTWTTWQEDGAPWDVKALAFLALSELYNNRESSTCNPITPAFVALADRRRRPAMA